MNKEEFVKTLTGVGKLYDKELDQETLTLWLSFFKENTIEEFKSAVNQHIRTSSKFPTVSDIKSKIYVLNNNEESNTDLWEQLLIAIRNGIYSAEEEFKKLSKPVQKFVGSPQQLTEMATMDSDVIHSVVKGQFLKQIEYIKQSIKEQELMSPQTKALLEQKGILKIESSDK